jgi:hypothetical protein
MHVMQAFFGLGLGGAGVRTTGICVFPPRESCRGTQGLVSPHPSPPKRLSTAKQEEKSLIDYLSIIINFVCMHLVSLDFRLLYENFLFLTSGGNFVFWTLQVG